MTSMDSELCKIPDIISYNHYFGWYAGKVSQNGPWLDKFHKKHPNICIGLSEYGCECVLDWHTETPKQGDYSEEYQCYYHEEMLKTFAVRPFIWSTHVWNMFDFAADARDEGGVKGMNNKGLVTYDRKIKKDSFYLYKAFWNKEPMVHLASKRYVYRCEDETKVLVYSNFDKVSLYVNGELFEEKEGYRVFEFKVPLNGKLELRAVAGDLEDTSVIEKVEKPYKDYILESDGGVSNWFDESGNGMTFNRDYFSIKDKMKTIMENPHGRALLEGMMAKMMPTGGEVAGFKVSEGMLKMMMNFTIERMAKMAGKMFPQEALAQINAALQQIKK
jgi:beta-galactosidase